LKETDLVSNWGLTS